ncbi:MAG: hypothetical protein J7497_02740 [Chitinophagaceae bacterium]|nr:hypothetical protein [Chitinophagaceae bacterium]
MTAEHFKKLCKSDQLTYLRFFGTVISERPFGGDRFYLYAINNFYIEVLWEFSSVNESVPKIVNKVFTDDHSLEPYLNLIDIEELISG